MKRDARALRRATSLVTAGLLVWLAGCQLAPASGPKSRAPRSAGAALVSGATAVPPGALGADGKAVLLPPSGLPVGPAAPAGLPANPGGAGVISNNSGSLVGVLRAPAALLSNNGGGLIGNHGGAYRLQVAPAELPVGGLQVALLDATGQAVLGADGRALVATTDAQGRYAFQGALPKHTLFLALTLPGGKGVLRALVPKEGASKVVDGDLISSLTTTYILDQYLSQAAEKQVALDRLSEGVVASTGAKALAAFVGTQAAVPAALNEATARSTIDAMRAGDAAFRSQMEAVKQLLIVAGQVGRGEGRLASEVSLEYSTGMAVGPDASVYLSSYENRVWRVQPDGLLSSVAGGKQADGSEGPIEGKLGSEVALGGVSAVGADAQGRPLVLADGRLFRIGEGGKVQVLWAQVPGGGHSFCAAADGRLLVLAGGTWGGNSLWELGAQGEAPRQLVALQKGSMDRVEDFGRNAAGQVMVRVYRHAERDEEGRLEDPSQPGGPQLCTVELSSGALVPIVGVPQDAHVDARGNILYVQAGRMMAQRGLGEAAKDLGAVPEEATVEYMALGPEGEGYIASYYQLYRLKDGVAKRIGGTDPKAGATGNASDYGFQDPSALAIASDGVRYVSDKGKGQLLRIDLQQQISTVPLAAPEFGEASGHSILRMGPGNQLHGLSAEFFSGGIQSISEGGAVVARVVPPNGKNLNDFLVGPDNSLYYSLGDWQAHTLQLMKQGPTETQGTKLLDLEFDLSGLCLAFDREGRILILNRGHSFGEAPPAEALGHKGLQRWSPEGGWEQLAADPGFSIPGDPNDSTTRVGLAVDAAGRIYGLTHNAVLRFDPATKATTTIAGPGGRLYTGSSVDDSLLAPCSPVFDAQGGLLVVDQGHRQIKRIPPEKLN